MSCRRFYVNVYSNKTVANTNFLLVHCIVPNRCCTQSTNEICGIYKVIKQIQSHWLFFFSWSANIKSDTHTHEQIVKCTNIILIGSVSVAGHFGAIFTLIFVRQKKNFPKKREKKSEAKKRTNLIIAFNTISANKDLPTPHNKFNRKKGKLCLCVYCQNLSDIIEKWLIVIVPIKFNWLMLIWFCFFIYVVVRHSFNSVNDFWSSSFFFIFLLKAFYILMTM